VVASGEDIDGAALAGLLAAAQFPALSATGSWSSAGHPRRSRALEGREPSRTPGVRAGLPFRADRAGPESRQRRR